MIVLMPSEITADKTLEINQSITPPVMPCSEIAVRNAIKLDSQCQSATSSLTAFNRPFSTLAISTQLPVISCIDYLAIFLKMLYCYLILATFFTS